MADNVYLRPAATSDVRMFFDWANEPAVRKNSFNTAEIVWENHVKWFHKVLSDDDTKIFVLMVNENPVGQVRLAREEHRWLISYSIAVECRGQGYGKLLLQMMEKEMSNNGYKGKELLAEIKSDNIASQRILNGRGYHEEVDNQHENSFSYTKVIA